MVEELRRTMHRLRDVALRNARRRTLLHRRAQAEEEAFVSTIPLCLSRRSYW